MTLSEDDTSRATSYKKRPIRPLGVFRPDPQIVFKGYGIHYAEDRSPIVDKHVLVGARRKVVEVATQQVPETKHHGVGFYIVHQGLIGTWLLVDWWVEEILLHHRLFRAGESKPDEFEPVNSSLICCTWEMVAIAHERDAWVRRLSTGGPNALEMYLNDFANLDS
jgi:hypothetical protein